MSSTGRSLHNEEQIELQFAKAVLSDDAGLAADPGIDEVPDPMASSTPRRKHRRMTVKTEVDVHIPPDILKRPKVAQSLVRNKVPSTAIASIMHEIVWEVNGDPAKLCLSYD